MQFPIYIPSKGRYEVRKTSDYLSYMQIPHNIVVEEQEYDMYRKHTQDNKLITLLILDKKFQEEYNTLDDLGNTKSKGPGPARNFAWEHSISKGYKFHWVMDDNIISFYRAVKNTKIRVKSQEIFTAMEDFTLRYENIYMSGPQYFMFLPKLQKHYPIVFNTRIYSCNLIKNDIPYRWRGRYNEDTILSLDILSDGNCTVQFNAFLQEKMNTQKLKGGNTDEFYAKEGTLPKSKMLVDTYPQFCKMMFRFNRIHHFCNYKVFKNNKAILKVDTNDLEKVNNYGMELKKII